METMTVAEAVGAYRDAHTAPEEATVDVAAVRAENESLRRRVRSLEGEVDQLRRQLQDRKLIERAKGLVMQESGKSEHDAYVMLREESQRRGVRMAEIAKSVILGYELMDAASAHRGRE